MADTSLRVKRPSDKRAQCSDCNKVKPPEEFYTYKRKCGLTLANRCKVCELEYKKRYKAEKMADPNSRVEYLERVRRSKEKRADKEKAFQLAYTKKRTEAARIARESCPVYRAKKAARKLRREQRELESSRMSFYQAWRDWLSIAPDEWLDELYKEKPWKDHRLTDAEKARVQRKHCPDFAIYDRMRSHLRRQEKDGQAATIMREAIKRNGSSPKIQALFGYTISELREHLERQFVDGMDWEAFCDGRIHIDHITPRSSFDMSKESELQACWCLSNLRPMWARENIIKSNNIEYLL